MSANTKIQWTDQTWNPVTGCTKVSSGCDHCYAETFAERFRGVKGHPFEHGFDVQLRTERLDQPLRWRKPRRVFVNSMSDLFHQDVPDSFIDIVFAVMGAAKDHTFQVLTKRPERMRRYLRDVTTRRMLLALEWLGNSDARFVERLVLPGTMPYPNVWLGVSIETGNFGWRAQMLREAPAAVRFLSLEPLLGSLDRLDLTGIDWVIVGGESGPKRRPMNLYWARDIRDRCKEHGIAFFFKQVSAFRPQDSMIPADLRIREYPSDKNGSTR